MDSLDSALESLLTTLDIVQFEPELCWPCSREAVSQGIYEAPGKRFPQKNGKCQLCKTDARLRCARPAKWPAPSLVVPWFWTQGLLPNTVDINTIIVYSKDDTRNADVISLDLGNDTRAKIVPEARISMPLVRTWIQQCDHHQLHDSCRTPLETRWPKQSTLIVIDVHRQCITQLDPSQDGFRYLALSYVWGGKVSRLMLTTRTRASLSTDQALARLSDLLPQVIKDAMTVVYELGERYLWIDSLCVVQDDATTKHDSIASMANVYSSAYLTICAIDGLNADAGLPGVRPSTRAFNTVSETAELRIATRPSRLSNILFRSYYHERGWIFQERLLSKRCLYFANEQVYFQCESNIWCEDRYPQRSSKSWEQRVGIPAEIKRLSPLPNLHDTSARANEFQAYSGGNTASVFKTYSRIVTEYTSKSLSYPDDMINAISGVLEALKSQTKWEIVCGLPASILCQSLLWVPTNHARRRCRTNSDTGAEPSSEFPSWSWIGWHGVVDYRTMPTWELWGNLDPFIDLITIEGSNGCVSLKQLLSPWGRPKPPDPLCYYPSGRLNVLHFWTPVSAASGFTYDVFPSNPECVGKPEVTLVHPIVRIRDRHDHHCGVFYGVDDEDLKTWRTQDCELLLISQMETLRNIQPSDGIPPIPMFDEKHYERKFSDRRWVTYNVMLVQLKSEFSERLAVGQIHSSAWKECQSAYKHVRLV